MKHENILYLAEPDSQFADIDLIKPTENYVDKGHAILHGTQAAKAKFDWRSCWVNAFPIFAAILVVLGFAVQIVGPDRELHAKLIETEITSTANSQTETHQLAALHARDVIGTASPSSTPDATQAITLDQLFIANCQECHELNVMEKLRPEDFEGTPERMNELMMQTIRELVGTLGS